MRFQLRMLRWGARGACEQALVLGVGGLGLTLTALVILLVTASLVLRVVVPRLERSADRRQARVLAVDAALLDHSRPAPRNATADRLEHAASELGIALAPDDAARRERPSAAAASELAAVADSFVDPLKPLPWPGAARYVAWRTAHRRQIENLAAAVLEGEPPRWRAGPSLLDRRDLDLAGLHQLEAVLLSEAWIAIIERRPDRTARFLESAWRTNQPLLDDPELAAHDASIAVLEEILAVLRAGPDPGDGWEERLAEIDPVTTARGAYLFEAWRLRLRATRLLADRHPQLGFVVQPFTRLLALPQQRALVDGVSRLDPAHIDAFDGGAFAADLDREIPRWNELARTAMPRSWRSWPAAVHAALAVSLTRHSLQVRRSFHATGMAFTGGPPPSWPEPLTRGSWTCRNVGGEVIIALDPDPFANRGRPALSQVVSFSRSDTGGG